jgi:methylmalonyl-CoA/ethylmalonyl-CoA epimerase
VPAAIAAAILWTSMIQSLHHIGIAVVDLDQAIPLYRDTLGLQFVGLEEVPTEKVKVAIFLAGATRIELLQATAADSPIAKFVAQRGGGVHHLAFATDSTQGMITALAAKGLPLLDRVPRPGAHGCKVAFIHPKGMHGVLTELVEDPK